MYVVDQQNVRWKIETNLPPDETAQSRGNRQQYRGGGRGGGRGEGGVGMGKGGTHVGKEVPGEDTLGKGKNEER